jgi:hypothetical protein
MPPCKTAFPAHFTWAKKIKRTLYSFVLANLSHCVSEKQMTGRNRGGMLENSGVVVSFISLLVGAYLIRDGVSGATDSYPFTLLSGAVLIAIGLIAAWSVTKSKLGETRIVRKYRHKARLSH